jgi:molecular chaperone GrpE
MVISKIKKVFSGRDEEYEVLYHKYSQIKLENKKLKEKHIEDKEEFEYKLHKHVAKELISIYRALELVKADSFKVHAETKELQKMMIDLNALEKKMKKTMNSFLLEEVEANERFYDPEIHDVASYQDAKGMAKGLVLKTVQKGFRYKGKIIVKPKVVVTK